MTKEEKAIMYFKDMRKKFCEDYLLGISKDSVAYKATMAEKEFYDTAIQALEQQSCEDAISRQAVDEITELMTDINGDTVYAVRMSDIRQLPSIKPQKPILSKIRAEIEQRPYGVANDSVIQGMKYERKDILEIIDKYKAESE